VNETLVGLRRNRTATIDKEADIGYNAKYIGK